MQTPAVLAEAGAAGVWGPDLPAVFVYLEEQRHSHILVQPQWMFTVRSIPQVLLVLPVLTISLGLQLRRLPTYVLFLLFLYLTLKNPRHQLSMFACNVALT